MKAIHKVFYKQVKANIWRLIFIIILLLLIVGLEAIEPWPFKILIDNVLGSNQIQPDSFLGGFLHGLSSRELLGFFAVFIYFMSTFLLTIVEYIHSVITKKVIKRITSSFSKSAFNNLQSLEIGYYNKQQIGDYIYRLSYDVSALGELIETGLIPFVTSSLHLIVTTIIMFMISVNLTLLSLIALPFLAIGLYAFNERIAKATQKSEHFNSAAFSFIEEALTHLKIIQAFSQQAKQSQMFSSKIDTSLENEVRVSKLDFLLTLVVGIIIAISYSVIIIYGIRSVFHASLTTGLLIVFIFYLDNLTAPILSIIYAVADIRQSYVKVLRMDEFFSKKTHFENTGTYKTIAEAGIRFDRVTLKGDQGKKILDDVSFTIEPHKRTVIFGLNGSGKTSIINLILRFINEPTSGDIYIDGINIKDYDIKTLRDSIAYVPQEISLFDDTIRNNISFGNKVHSFKAIKEAAHLAAADEFIKKLPGHYDFDVGEAGTFLSGGQRQRLMLARALMKKDAKILLFDETLSALDVKNREQVVKNILTFSESKTTILVSNIFSIISAADRIIVLHKGKSIYSGPSSHLPQEISLYKMISDND